MAQVRQNEVHTKFRTKQGAMADFTGSETASQEIPEGAMNAENRVFMLKNRPIRETEQLFKDGMMMARSTDEVEADYSIDYEKRRIVFSPNQVPQPKSVIRITYRYMKEG